MGAWAVGIASRASKGVAAASGVDDSEGRARL
jgi:hypothetical protein